MQHFNIQVASESTNPDLTAVFCARLHGGFIDIKGKLKKETS